MTRLPPLTPPSAALSTWWASPTCRPRTCWQFTATCCPPTPTCRMLSLTITRSTPNYRVVVDSPDNIEAVSQQLRQIDGVYQVNAPLEMSKVFVSLQKVVSYACYGIVLVLAIVSIVVINNTIKITVFNRRKEINIMKLVGATNGFIRFPFFVEGVTSGLISAALASGIICGAYYAPDPLVCREPFQSVPDVWRPTGAAG